MKSRTPLCIALLSALAACSGDAPPEESSESAEPAAAQEPSPITGFLILDGAPVITLCSSGEELSVDGPALPDLLELHTSLAPGVEPLEGIFVDVLGTIRDRPGGPEVDALEVRRAAWEGGGCGDPEAGLVYSASGTEPFWSLTVLEETLTWRTPEGERTMEHAGRYRMDRGGLRVDGISGEETSLVARFYPEPCRNAMSGAWFHMTAEVELDGTRYQGCAWSAS